MAQEWTAFGLSGDNTDRQNDIPQHVLTFQWNAKTWNMLYILKCVYNLLVVFSMCPDSCVYAQDRIRVDGGRLTISNINLMDSGMYQCLAENDNGVIYASAELKVVGKQLSMLSN